MKDCLGRQGQLERLKLPDSPDQLEAIASDPGMASEFLQNMRYMQKCMNQIMDHQVTEERKHFFKSLKSAKLTASVMSQFTTAAALIDVIAMMQSECKALLVMDTSEVKSRMENVEGVSFSHGQYAGVSIGFILLMVQIFSTILLACSHRN